MASDKPVKPFQRGAASGEIYNVLRDEILTLRLAPGSPLDETSLSKRISVSRSPIREAFNRLLAERLVETLPNRSTIVAPVDLRSFAPFIQALDVHQRLASRLAAQNRTEADVLQLAELAHAFDESVEGAEALDIMQTNFAFHVAVGEAGRNPYVTRHYRELLSEAGRNPYVTRHYRELLSEARRLLHIHVQFLSTVNRKDVLRNQHHDFVDAIHTQDIARADAIAHDHTMQFHDRFLKALRYTPDLDFDIGLSTIPIGKADR